MSAYQSGAQRVCDHDRDDECADGAFTDLPLYEFLGGACAQVIAQALGGVTMLRARRALCKLASGCICLTAVRVAAAEAKRRKAEELLLFGEAASEKLRLDAAAKRAAKKERQLRQKAAAQREAEEKAAAEVAAAERAGSRPEQASYHDDPEVRAGYTLVCTTQPMFWESSE